MDLRGGDTLQTAEQYLRNGNKQEARTLLVEYVRESPNSAKAWWMLSFALTDVQQQIDCVKRVLEIDPNNPAARTRLSKLEGDGISQPAVSPFLSETNKTSVISQPKSKSPNKTNWTLLVAIFTIFICVSIAAVSFLVMYMGGQTAQANIPSLASLAPTQTLPPTWTPVIADTALPTNTPAFTPTLLYTLTPSDVLSSDMALMTGEVAPDFELQNVASGRTRLSDYAGHPMILFFFTTWSKYSMQEVPYLQKIHDDYQNDNLIVLAIDLGESSGTASSFRDSTNVTFPVLVDPNQTLADLYKVTAVPTNYFVQPDGKVSTFVRGLSDYATLNIKVRVLLNLIPVSAP